MKRNSIEYIRSFVAILMTQHKEYVFTYMLLAVALIIAYAQFESMPFASGLMYIRFYIMAVGIVSGLSAIWLSRERLSQEIENQDTMEELAEQERYQNFPARYPALNRVPVIRRVFRWGYKEGWIYSIGFVTLVLLSSFLFSYNLGGHEIREDEFQVVDAAAGYHYTGTFYQWNWLEDSAGEEVSCVLEFAECEYTRAWPHSWMIAQSFNAFGISEWSARLVSVIFGVIFIAASYPIIKFFIRNKLATLLTVFVFVFNPFFINTFRYARMYAVLIPIFLILFYLLYRGITEDNKLKLKPNWLDNFINKNLNFNYLLLAPALALLCLNYLIHVNSLVILPILLLFVTYLAIVKKERKYIISTTIGWVGSIVTSLIYSLGITDRFMNHLSLFERRNYEYLEYITQFPFFWEIGAILLSIGLALIFIYKDSRDKLVYLYTTILFALLFFIWIADRYAGGIYISHIVPISIAVLVLAYCLISRVFKERIVRVLLYVLIATFSLVGFYNSIEGAYSNETRYGRYKDAYPTIVEDFDPETDVIFGQYLRRFYLRDLTSHDPEIISMLNNRQYELDEFLSDLEQYESGYITWETRKRYHLIDEVADYVTSNFEQIHGSGVDDTRIEVYYFSNEMAQ